MKHTEVGDNRQADQKRKLAPESWTFGALRQNPEAFQKLHKQQRNTRSMNNQKQYNLKIDRTNENNEMGKLKQKKERLTKTLLAKLYNISDAFKVDELGNMLAPRPTE